jgi:FdhE protein
VGAPPPFGLAQAVVSWDERIARARALAADAPHASTILSFYADLAGFQKRLTRHAPPTDLAGAAGVAAASIGEFLEWLCGNAPAPLASAAAGGRARPVQDWIALMEQRIETGESEEDGPTAFIVEAVLQPFAEQVVRLTPDATDGAVRLKPDPAYDARCPGCASLPVVAALREEGQGARRSLVCGLCFTEWAYPRIQCPSCKENRFDALPVYTSEVQANARIDACDSCRAYVKTVDMSKDGLAVPIVDDLASLPLDLWARDRGYQRLYPNLLRL